MCQYGLVSRLRWFLLGIVTAVALAVAAAALVLVNGRGFSASQQPTAFEAWLARATRSAAIPSDARMRKNPVPNTPEVLADARAHWADHCAVCHANNGSGDTEMGKHTYPRAPDMRLAATQQLSDGELFYVIQNGVRLTAMPAWSTGGEKDAEDSWKMVHFIRHLPTMSTVEAKEMETMNPRTPRELKEEEEEARFLKGEDTNDHSTEHHHQ